MDEDMAGVAANVRLSPPSVFFFFLTGQFLYVSS